MNRNTSRFGVLVVVLMMIGSVFAAGGAVAQEDATILVDDSIDPLEETTESAYVDVTGVADMNGSGPVDVTVTLTGMNASDDTANDTVIDETTISVAEDSTESVDVDFTDSDREDYERVDVLVQVDTDGEEDLIDSVDWGTLERTSGGAGGGFGGTGLSMGAVGVIVVALAFFVMKD